METPARHRRYERLAVSPSGGRTTGSAPPSVVTGVADHSGQGAVLVSPETGLYPGTTQGQYALGA
jgi:hypothetical protein